MGVDASNSAFAAVNGAAPSNAMGALLRLDVGPAGYDDDYAGFDMLVFINLMADDLSNPMLGIDPLSTDPDFLQALLSGGFANSASFGGTGPQLLTDLGGFSVYATLISETGTIFNASADGAADISGVQLADGEFAFLLAAAAAVPEPSMLIVFGLGVLGLGVTARRRRRSS